MAVQLLVVDVTTNSCNNVAMYKVAIEKAIETVGTQSELARKIGVFPQQVQKWFSTGLIPPNRVLAVEKATNGQVTRYELRPDIYPPSNAV